MPVVFAHKVVAVLFRHIKKSTTENVQVIFSDALHQNKLVMYLDNIHQKSFHPWEQGNKT